MKKSKKLFVVCLLVIITVFSTFLQSNAMVPNPFEFARSDTVLYISGDVLYGLTERQNAVTVASEFLYSEAMVISGDPVGTGDTISVIYNDIACDNIVVLVYGDVNGDGRVTSNDYLLIKKSVNNPDLLTGLYFEAADVNCDGVVSTVDYFRIKKHFTGGYNIYENIPPVIPPEPTPKPDPKLIVNGEDITEGNHVLVMDNCLRWVELPFLAICESLGAEVKWNAEYDIEIYLNGILYNMDITENTLYKNDSSGDFYNYFETNWVSSTVENDYIIEGDCLKYFLNQNNYEIEIDYDNVIVNIFYNG